MDQYPEEISKILQTFLSITQFIIIIKLNMNQNVIVDLVMIVIVCYIDLCYIYFNQYDRYFSLKDKNNTLDWTFILCNILWVRRDFSFVGRGAHSIWLYVKIVQWAGSFVNC